MPLKAIFFDLDGTLVDTAEDFLVVLNDMRQARNLAPLDPLSVRQTVSEGARALVTLGFNKQEGDEGFEALRQELLDRYSAILGKHAQLFAGLDAVLTYIKEKQLAWGIATNKPRAYAEPLLKALQFDPPYNILICPDDVSEKKPHPESLWVACRAVNCAPNEAIYLGDHQRDIACGQNASMPTIACSYGYVPKDEDVTTWHADFICNDSLTLLSLIKQIDK